MITFHRTNSHGALLQAYSLYKFISSLGYDVQFIDYSTRNKTQLEPFKKYANEYLAKTNRIDTFNELEQIEADILICGSDQIWNLDITLSENPNRRWDFYFLNFGNSTVKRIAYAASCGGINIQKKYRETAKKTLNVFDYISVREEGTRDIIAKLTDKPIDIAIDPVFLTEDFPIRKPEMTLPDRYIAITSTQRNTMLYETMRTIKEHFKLPVVVCDSLGKCPLADIYLPMLRPDEWLYVIKNSEYVCANSFHAISFAIKFRKQFVASVLLNESLYDKFYRVMVEKIYQTKMDKYFSSIVKRPLSAEIKKKNIHKKMCRIVQILSMAGLSNRIAMNRSDVIHAFEKIDYTKVKKNLEKTITYSMSQLKEHLK